MESMNKKNINMVDGETKTMENMEKTVPVTRDIVYILDESGSMESMSNEPRDSVNRTVADQKALNIPGTKFTLVKFNSFVTVVYDDVPLEDVTEFTDYRPREMTALYDAIGTAIEKKKAKGEGKYDNVICVILTDGYENCSKDYTLKKIRAMIKEMEKNHSWQFVYAAANQDAFAVGATLGVSNCVDYAPTQFGLGNMTRDISGGIARMRSGESTSVEIYPSISAPPVLGSQAPGSPRTPTHAPRMTRAGAAFGSPPRLKRTRKMTARFGMPPPPLRIPKDGDSDGDDAGHADDELVPIVSDANFETLITLKRS